ncbi:MAG: Asp-tRNA(Asn)/Glu-tRNA(Gln) amidotransferase subunit GatA [bacterium]
MKLNELTIREARLKLEQGEITSLELTQACLLRIKEVDPMIHACLTVCETEALTEAVRADERRAQGEKGELLGIPYLCKDNILTSGIKTTASSKMLENYIAPYDATVVKKLREAGAVLLGKVNLDEFAHGASTENSAFGVTHNPWDLARVPGGSSGGSAAAVAADMCLFALGTDTGGSIRCPAAFCGVVGLKPTYGRSSRFGLVSMTSSTDVPGALCKTVEDVATVQKAISGLDKFDATTVDEKIVNYNENLGNSIKGLKIGLPEEYFTDGTAESVTQAVNRAIEQLKQLGAEFVSVKLSHTKYAVPVYYILTPSELSSNLARHDGIRYGFSTYLEEKNLQDVYNRTRGRGFGEEAKRRIMLGTYALSAGYFDAYYLQAQRVRTIIKEELDQVLREVDLLLTPVSPHPAFKIGEQANDPLKMYLEDIFVTSPSLAGLPAMSVPCGFSEIDGKQLPLAFQLIGSRFDENKLLQVGHQYQKVTNFHLAKAKI